MKPATWDVARAELTSIRFSEAKTLEICRAAADQPAADRIHWLADRLGGSADAALEWLARSLGMEAMSAKGLSGLRADFSRAPFAECQKRGAVIATTREAPQDGTREQVFFVCHDPFSLDQQYGFEPLLESVGGSYLQRVLTLQEDFVGFLESAEGNLRALDSIESDHADAGTTGPEDLLLSIASIEAAGSSTVRLVDSTLYDALKAGASDIHFELQHGGLDVRYRLDGVLQTVKRMEGLDAAHQVISRIKVLADLDIAEQRIPQDGRFRVRLDTREIDFRVSVMPNAAGEDAVLRILDRKHLTGSASALTLDSLSFADDVKQFIRQSARLPYGLLLVTGPTGSGKTTTLYAAISEINSGLDKIVTIEDPIEYQLAGVLQIPVNERKGLTFAKGLRSILRHDPDKIMVGEIRDSETAQIAVQAALTGHQVFTTVHANNVFDVIGRFSNMGVDSYSLVAALSGIMAQRLVRKVCPECAQWLDVSSDELATLGAFDKSIPPARQVRKAAGCASCRGTGYRGRAAVAETLPIDDEMKDLLVQHAPITSIKTAARNKGFSSLRDSALALVLAGVTTFEEVDRVTPVL